MSFSVLQPKCQLRDLRNRFPCIDPMQNLQVELVRRYRSGMYDNGAQMGIHIVNYDENRFNFIQQNQRVTGTKPHRVIKRVTRVWRCGCQLAIRAPFSNMYA